LDEAQREEQSTPETSGATLHLLGFETVGAPSPAWQRDEVVLLLHVQRTGLFSGAVGRTALSSLLRLRLARAGADPRAAGREKAAVQQVFSLLSEPPRKSPRDSTKQLVDAVREEFAADWSGLDDVARDILEREIELQRTTPVEAILRQSPAVVQADPASISRFIVLDCTERVVTYRRHAGKKDHHVEVAVLQGVASLVVRRHEEEPGTFWVHIDPLLAIDHGSFINAVLMALLPGYWNRFDGVQGSLGDEGAGREPRFAEQELVLLLEHYLATRGGHHRDLDALCSTLRSLDIHSKPVNSPTFRTRDGVARAIRRFEVYAEGTKGPRLACLQGGLGALRR
jgi:hypothetical protein